MREKKEFLNEAFAQSVFDYNLRCVLFRAMELIMVYLAADLDTQYLHEYANFSSIHDLRGAMSLALINQDYIFGEFLPELPHVR